MTHTPYPKLELLRRDLRSPVHPRTAAIAHERQFQQLRLPLDMICQRCLRRLAHSTIPFGLSRSLSTTAAPRLAQAVTAQTTTATNPRPNDLPAATSTSAAQPFSTPLSPSPENSDLPIQSKRSKDVAPKVQSSVPAGTVLKGLNFMKNQQDPVALEDHEYPAWLWDVLNDRSEGATGKGGDGEGDLFCTSRSSSLITPLMESMLMGYSQIEETTSSGCEGVTKTAIAEPGISGAEGPNI